MAGKAAVLGKPQLGKNVHGVQTRARAALGDRSNTIHSDAANKPPSKAPSMAKKAAGKTEVPHQRQPQVSKPAVAAGLKKGVRDMVKAALPSRARSRQAEQNPKLVPVPKLEEHEDCMEVDETNRSIHMDVDNLRTPKRVKTDDDENDASKYSLPESDRKNPSRSVQRAEYRQQLVERFGGGIAERGNSTTDRITNPDLADENNTQMVSKYVYAIFDYLQDVETERMPLTEDFLDHCTEITSRMRYVLVDWMVQIHSRFEMLPETFYLAVGLMDRYLSTPAGIEITKENLQLLGVTAMMVAAKFEEMYPPEVSDFVYVTGNSFSIEDIRVFEWKLLSGTGFFCSLPTPIVFLRRFSRLIQASSEMHSAAKYFLELSTTEYSLCHLTGCIRAAASICLAHVLMRYSVDSIKWKAEDVTDDFMRSLIKEAWLPNLQFSAGFTEADLFPVVQQIAAVAERQVAPSKYRAIHSKYSSGDVYSIAIRQELRCPLLSLYAMTPEENAQS